MSGTMHREVAAAAARLAAQAAPMPEGPGRLAFKAKRASLRAEVESREAEQAARDWWQTPERIRVLVALTVAETGAAAKRIAAMRWAEIDEETRRALNVNGLDIRRGLAGWRLLPI